MVINNIDINVVEATTHEIKIRCKDSSGSKFELLGYKAVFILVSNEDIYKKVVIDGNTINVKIEPEDTKGKCLIPFECRIFNPSGDVYHVVLGCIKIKKAKRPITEYVEVA